MSHRTAPALVTVAACIAAGAGCAPVSEETSSGGEGGGSSTATVTATSEPLHASFVLEEKAGDGPALLRMFNDSEDQILSLTLDDGRPFTFYLIEPLSVSDYAITASDDMWTDAILSIHTLDTCVRKPFSEMTGPNSLEPGHAYAIHIFIADGFVAQIEEEPMPDPYMGLRALVNDPSSSSSPTPGPSKLALSLGGAAPGEVVFETIFTEFPEPYQLHASAKVEMEKVRFVDRSGAAHERQSPFVLDKPFGYTVHISPAAVDGAEVDVTLDAVSP